MFKWVVFVAGALMSAAGFAWLWQGLGIVQVERGWSAVIAGAVVFSAGAVLMGLAALIRQIELLGAHALPIAPAKAAPVPKSPPAIERFEQPDLKEAPPEAPPETSGLTLEPPGQFPEPELNLVEQQELELETPKPPASVRPPALKPPPSLPRASIPDFTSGKMLVGEADANRGLEFETSSENKLQAPKLQARRSESLAPDSPATAHWKSVLSKAKAGDSAARQGGVAPPVVTPVPPPVASPGMKPAPVPPAEAGVDGRIARRYESQGVRYSLYEDGSIEAETDTGTFRFGSLVELRAFLDQRKG